jgi:hypothetical protein
MKEGAGGDAIVVHLTGCKVSLDEETFYRIHDQLLALADEPSGSDLLLDFGNVVKRALRRAFTSSASGANEPK